MNRQDASARLEALLARVIARKDAPRAPSRPRSHRDGPHEGRAEPHRRAARRRRVGRPEVSLHPPLAGDLRASAPRSTSSSARWTSTCSSLEATVASASDQVTRVDPFVRPPPEMLPELLSEIDEPAPTVTVSSPEEGSSLDLSAALEPEPEPSPAPTARLSEPDAFMPVSPVAHMVEPAHAPPAKVELRAPTPAPVQVEAPKVAEPPKVEAPVLKVETPAVVEAPKVEAPAVVEAPKAEALIVVEAPKVEAPAVVEAPKVEAPKVEAPAVVEAPKVEAPRVERFEPEALPVAAAVVQVVAAAPPAPRTLRELLTRSLALRVRPAKG